MIVISYKSVDRIAEAIAAHEQAMEHLKGELIIVDNASNDGTVELARSLIQRGYVIANSENVGYGHAANQGISAARGRYTMILNDDARLSAEAVDRLIEALELSDAVALAGPRIVDEQGEDMPSARLSFPGLNEELSRAKDILKRRNANRIYPGEGPEAFEVAWLVGACIVGKTEILRQVGGFNPAFFLYAEDIDLCRRLEAVGYKSVTVPEAVCVHTGSVSTQAAFDDHARIVRRADAREIFYRIWYSKLQRVLIHLRRAIGIQNQPWRIKYHLSKMISDGGSLAEHRFPPPLERSASTESS